MIYGENEFQIILRLEHFWHKCHFSAYWLNASDSIILGMISRVSNSMNAIIYSACFQFTVPQSEMHSISKNSLQCLCTNVEMPTHPKIHFDLLIWNGIKTGVNWFFRHICSIAYILISLTNSTFTLDRARTVPNSQFNNRRRRIFMAYYLYCVCVNWVSCPSKITYKHI